MELNETQVKPSQMFVWCQTETESKRLKRINYPINAHRCIFLVAPRWVELARRGWGCVLEGGGKLPTFFSIWPSSGLPHPMKGKLSGSITVPRCHIVLGSANVICECLNFDLYTLVTLPIDVMCIPGTRKHPFSKLSYMRPERTELSRTHPDQSGVYLLAGMYLFSSKSKWVPDR